MSCMLVAILKYTFLPFIQTVVYPYWYKGYTAGGRDAEKACAVTCLSLLTLLHVNDHLIDCICLRYKTSAS